MSVTPLNEIEIQRKIHGFIRKAQSLLDVRDADLAEVLGVRAQEVQGLLHGRNFLSVGQLFSVLSFFNIPMDRVLNDEVDFKLLHQHFNPLNLELPEHYQVGANGRKRSVINILKYIERHFGARELEIVLKQFQLSTGHFNDPEDRINNRFLVDLLNKLEELGYGHEHFINMGEESFDANRDNELGKLQAQARNTRELIERTFNELICFYDTNYHYKIERLTDTEAQISFKQDSMVAEALKAKRLGSLNADIMKMGVVKSLPRYISSADLEVTIAKSVHLGDDHSAYHIAYDKSRRLRLVQ